MSFYTIWILGIVVGLTLLTLLLTGPGMWSEKWGWGWFEKKKDGEQPASKGPPPPGSGRPG